MSKFKLNPDLFNALYPVVGVRVRPSTLEIIRKGPPGLVYRNKQKGEKIMILSRRSLARFVLAVGKSTVSWRSLLTLTYGVNYPLDGKTSKRHLRNILQALRRRFPGVSYFWFLEFQRRGAVHFHVGLSVSPTWEDRAWLAKRWGNIVEPGNWEYQAGRSPEKHWVPSEVLLTRDAVVNQHYRKKVWEDVKSKDGAIRYVVKYSTKPHQKTVPDNYADVGRFWGLSGNSGDVGFTDFVSTESEVRELAEVLGRDMVNFDILPSIIFHSGKLPRQDFDNVRLFD